MPALVASGLAPLDRALGGLPPGSVVHVYGPSGAGKTTLALAAAAANAPAALVLPEQPHPARVAAVLGDRLKGMLVARPRDLDEQGRAVERAATLLVSGRVRSIVLDSLTFLYRFEHLSSLDALQVVYRQLGQLHRAARASGRLVVFTNQVRGGPNGHEPLGGPAVAHASDVIVSLEVLEGDWRRARLVKHPLRAAGEAWDVRIGPTGLA